MTASHALSPLSPGQQVLSAVGGGAVRRRQGELSVHTRVAGQEISRTALAWETWGPGHLKTEPSGVPGSTHGVTGGKLRPGEGTKKPLAQAWILASASPAVTERRGRRGQSQQALAQCNAARAQGGKLLPPGQAPSGTQPSGPAPRSHQGANSGMAHRCPRWMPAPPRARSLRAQASCPLCLEWCFPFCLTNSYLPASIPQAAHRGRPLWPKFH